MAERATGDPNEFTDDWSGVSTTLPILFLGPAVLAFFILIVLLRPGVPKTFFAPLPIEFSFCLLIGVKLFAVFRFYIAIYFYIIFFCFSASSAA